MIIMAPITTIRQHTVTSLAQAASVCLVTMVTKPIFTKLRAHVKESLPLEKAVGLPERLLVKFTGVVLRTLKKPERDTFLAEGGGFQSCHPKSDSTCIPRWACSAWSHRHHRAVVRL